MFEESKESLSPYLTKKCGFWIPLVFSNFHRAITRQTQELLDMLFNLQQWFETKVCVNNISWINTISDIFIWSAEFRKWGMKFIVLSSALKWYKIFQFLLNFANIFALRYFVLFILESSNVYFSMRETNLKAQWCTNFFFNSDSDWSLAQSLGIYWSFWKCNIYEKHLLILIVSGNECDNDNELDL